MKSINVFLREVRDFSKKDSVKAIIYHDDQILILRRQNDQPGAGNWDLPGGCIEKGESKKDALKREVFEETGLEIQNDRFVRTVQLKIPTSGIDSNMHIYRCKSESGNVSLKPADWKGSDGKPEHTEYRWIFKKEDIETLPMLDVLKNVVIDEFS